MRAVRHAALAVGLLLLFFIQPTFATATLGRSPDSSSASRIERTVLALFDGTNEGLVDETRIHKYLELPLNHLGYKVVYWDVSRGPPAIEELRSYKRVVTWFAGPLAHSVAYLNWASEAAKTGMRFAILDHTGIPLEDDSFKGPNALLAHLGLELTGFVTVTYKSEITHKDQLMLGFEHSLDPILPEYPVVRIRDKRVVSHLSIRHVSDSKDVKSEVITTGPGGGYVPSGFEMFSNSSIDRVQWVLNPFAFFEAAFGDGLRPVPDVTTVSGRRLYFSHIDGDGWNNVSEVEPYRESGSLSSEVVLRELIAPYPDMPVSVGLIAGDVDPDLGEAKDSRKVARQLFQLPQVEVASHTYSHPYDWSFFQNYDRKAEVELVSQAARDIRPKPYQKIFGKFAAAFGLERFRTDIDKWISGSDALPRTYLKRPFELWHEIAGSLDMASSLAPANKRAALFQWSGNTDPFPAALRMTRDLGVRNINGGDSRFDGNFPSVAYVAPIARPVDHDRQIYAVNSNENTYTNDWSGPHYAQRFLEKTLHNTEEPRRLKGVNVYYHMYTGEKPASLSAVKYLIEQARVAKLIPIKASEYAALADSFFGVEIRAISPLVWSITNRESLQTVRFDDADRLVVHFPGSVGVIGQNRHGGSLYVALDPAAPNALVALKERKAGEESSRVPQLLESRWQFSNLVRRDCGFSARAVGFGHGEMTWRGLSDGSYQVTARRGDRTLWDDKFTTRDGQLKLKIEVDAVAPIDIEFKCIGNNKEAAWTRTNAS